MPARNLPAATSMSSGARGQLAGQLDAIADAQVPAGGMPLAQSALANFSNAELASTLTGGAAKSSKEYKSTFQAVRRLRNSVQGTGHQARGLGKKFEERLSGSKALRDALKKKLGWPSGGVRVKGEVELIYNGVSQGKRTIDLTLTTEQLDKIAERIADGEAGAAEAILNTITGSYMEAPGGSANANAYTSIFDYGEGTALTLTSNG